MQYIPIDLLNCAIDLSFLIIQCLMRNLKSCAAIFPLIQSAEIRERERGKVEFPKLFFHPGFPNFFPSRRRILALFKYRRVF